MPVKTTKWKPENLKTGYIAKWNEYPTDEVKIRVCRPGPLGTPKDLGKLWTDQKITWDEFELRYLLHVMMNKKAHQRLMEILAMLKEGKTVRLMCYEREAPCHRFTLKNMLEVFLDKEGYQI